MDNSNFVHSHVHSSYSRFDGLANVPDLVLQARKMGFRALALTDHGNVGGWIKFYQECKKKKDKKDKPIEYDPIKPILGAEYYLCRNHNAHTTEEQKDGRKGNRHIILQAMSQKGYENLCKLSQRSFVEGQFHDPRIDLYDLAECSDGVFCQTACLGSIINSNLLHGRDVEAERAAGLLSDIFGDNMAFEVMYHGIDEEAVIIPKIMKLANKMNKMIIASNDCHYILKEHAKSQELLMAMSTSRCIKDPKHMHFPHDEFYLKSADEMAKIFGSHPEFLTNTLAIAERVEDYLQVGGMRLPKFNLDEARAEMSKSGKFPQVPDGKTPHEFLEQLAWIGMKRLKWDKSEEHIAALKMELEDVRIAKENNDMDFATYFLIVWDYINYARSRKILTGCGRGSGYASILLMCLGITYGKDPISLGLFWERFLAFDDLYFINDSLDLGIKTKEEQEIIDSADIDEERVVEEDQGGVDRY